MNIFDVSSLCLPACSTKFISKAYLEANFSCLQEELVFKFPYFSDQKLVFGSIVQLKNAFYKSMLLAVRFFLSHTQQSWSNLQS
jgi:hypothetical protein